MFKNVCYFPSLITFYGITEPMILKLCLNKVEMRTICLNILFGVILTPFHSPTITSFQNLLLNLGLLFAYVIFSPIHATQWSVSKQYLYWNNFMWQPHLAKTCLDNIRKEYTTDYMALSHSLYFSLILSKYFCE